MIVPAILACILGAMCVSATTSFSASAVIGAMGVFTLFQKPKRSQLLFALIPALVFGYGLSLDLNKIKDTLSATQNLTIGDSLEQEVEIGRAISGRLLGAHNLMADNQLQQYS